MPPYTQYVLESSVDEVLLDVIRGIEGLGGMSVLADEAVEMEVKLGRVTTLPLAAYVRFARLTSAKPDLFFLGIFNCFLSSVLHPELVVVPSLADPSIKISPRYWATPTGDATTGKSPTCSLMKNMFLESMREVPQLWPFAKWKDGNLYSDGSHGAFNEKIRDWQGRIVLLSSEATNQLAP
jgi:hypothetical protein